MNVVLLEVSHWHTPLYLDALERLPNVTVTAVSDATASRGPQLADRFGAKLYESWQTLLAHEEADFAFAFGPHDELHEMGMLLLDKMVPFAMEKPCGLNSDEVLTLYRRAEERDLFVAVPLVWRHSELFNRLTRLASERNARWRTMAFRFNAGPPGRYLVNHCAWMLDPDRSGGGCTINLAPHFIDLVEQLSGEAIRSVSAVMHADPQLTAVEICSMITLVTDSGCICTIETGYNYPGNTSEQREYSFSLSTDQFYVRSIEDGLRLTYENGHSEDVQMSLNSDVYYGKFVEDVLAPERDLVFKGARISSMDNVMSVLEAAYESNRRGGSVVNIVPH